MDIKNEVTKIVDQLNKNPEKMESFKKDPLKALKDMGIELPEGAADQVINAVKVANLDVNDLADKAKGLLNGFMK